MTLLVREEGWRSLEEVEVGSKRHREICLVVVWLTEGSEEYACRAGTGINKAN